MNPFPPKRRIRWASSYRVINTRFPPIDVFERVADPEDWETLIQLEMLTNPRIRDQVGDISLVPKHERVSGPGASWTMAPFTHIGWKSRFTDGSFGVYYAGKALLTSLHEKAFHFANFLAATDEPRGTFSEFRAIVANVDARLFDIRKNYPQYHKSDNCDADYAEPQALARTLRDNNARGIVYNSVRHPKGQCIAAFWPSVLTRPIGGPYLRYHWNGTTVNRVFNFSEKRWIPLFLEKNA